MNEVLKIRTVKSNLTNSASVSLPRGTLVSGISQLAFYVEQMDINKKKKSIFGEESVRK